MLPNTLQSRIHYPGRVLGSLAVLVCAVFMQQQLCAWQNGAGQNDDLQRQDETPIRWMSLADDPEPRDAAAGLIAALASQHLDPNSIEAIRTLQRTFRDSGNSSAHDLCLQEILRLTQKQRRQNEFLRYAEYGVDQNLTDKKLALRAAVSLTDSRKYELAARYYQKWLDLNPPNDESYLSLLVSIEMGRLWYLARKFDLAESSFRKVLKKLNENTLPEQQRQQLLRNSETTYRMMANTFLQTGDFKLARELYDLAGIDSTSPIQFLIDSQIALANGEFEPAKQLVLRFIAKQPNHSEAYLLLREILQQQSSSDEKADQAFLRELEGIRKKFHTGKVLDDILINHYLKLGQTAAAKTILIQQRSDTLWRDAANRQLIDIAFREQNQEDLLRAVSIEVDEHDTMSAIRSTLKKYQTQIDARSTDLFKVKLDRIPDRLGVACLLLYQDKSPVDSVVQQLISDIDTNENSPTSEKIKWLSLLGRECVTQKRYELGLICFQKCLALNRDQNDDWADKRIAFDALLSSSFCHTRLDQREQAIRNADEAAKAFRYSPSLLHLQAWLHIQFGEYHQAIVAYQAFLDRFDKVGSSRSLDKLIERARVEMAFALFQIGKQNVSEEILNQALDRNPIGPDLDAFERNNQKYKDQILQFIEFANGVKNGGPFPLGRY